MDKLMSLREVEKQIDLAKRYSLNADVFKQLADTMRDNERLWDFYKCFGIAHDRDGARVVQSGARGSVLEKYKALSYKDTV